MLDADRLDELDTLRLDDDCPDDAMVRIPARDLKDLVRLVSVLRAAVDLRDEASGWVASGDCGRMARLGRAIQRFDDERVSP